jgi:hypothetical protein
MASEVLNLTAQIVISHASMTELSPKGGLSCLDLFGRRDCRTGSHGPGPPSPETASRENGRISRGQGG